VKASLPVSNDHPVLIAGEPERLSRARRLASGVPIDQASWAEILTAAKTAGAGDAASNAAAAVLSRPTG